MADRLTGKRVLVTAAAQGMGRAAVIALAREGAEVIATDINAAELQTLPKERISTRMLDVTDGRAIAALPAATGPIDVLFNCAGIVPAGTILDCDEATWQRAFDINAGSMFRLSKAYLPGMIEKGGGAIINMASVASSIVAVPNRFAYGASKAAVIGLTKSIAADFVTRGIRAHAICPGTVQSPSLDERISAMGDYETVKKAFVARQPMGRLGTAEEVAMLVVFLASDEAPFMTGNVIEIDGGLSNV